MNLVTNKFKILVYVLFWASNIAKYLKLVTLSATLMHKCFYNWLDIVSTHFHIKYYKL